MCDLLQKVVTTVCVCMCAEGLAGRNAKNFMYCSLQVVVITTHHWMRQKEENKLSHKVTTECESYFV